MIAKQALILFTRDPLQESVHKRILNSSQANIALYQNLISHTLHIVDLARRQALFDIFISSDAPIDTSITPGIKGYIQQDGRTFSQKLWNTIEEAFRRGYQQVVTIGNDCPDLSAQQLMSAFQQLRTYDVVLGPATDGGVYLIGLNQAQSHYFADVKWYSASVYDDLQKNIRNLNHSVQTLDMLSDMDTLSVLNQWSHNTSNLFAWIILQLLGQPQQLHHVFHASPFNHKRHLSRRTWQKAPPPFI
jgi:rSAM/selenodomain-associated transferase 1